MKQIPPIKAVMTPFPYSVGMNDPVSRVRQLMADFDICHLPVMADGQPISVVSDRDVHRAQGAVRSLRQGKLRVKDLNTQEAYVVELSEPLDRVLRRMAERHARCAVVVKEGRLAGIFTVTDACRCFGEFLRTLFPDGGDDAA